MERIMTAAAAVAAARLVAALWPLPLRGGRRRRRQPQQLPCPRRVQAACWRLRWELPAPCS